MIKKLFYLSFVLMMLVGMLAMPGPVSAANNCPSGCPLPGSSASSYCQSQCPGAGGYYYECYNQCYNGVQGAAQSLCSECNVCCSY
jgi:hypothetical protein